MRDRRRKRDRDAHVSVAGAAGAVKGGPPAVGHCSNSHKIVAERVGAAPGSRAVAPMFALYSHAEWQRSKGSVRAFGSMRASCTASTTPVTRRCWRCEASRCGWTRASSSR